MVKRTRHDHHHQQHTESLVWRWGRGLIGCDGLRGGGSTAKMTTPKHLPWSFPPPPSLPPNRSRHTVGVEPPPHPIRNMPNNHLFHASPRVTNPPPTSLFHSGHPNAMGFKEPTKCNVQLLWV
jgi:hypothetical protein